LIADFASLREICLAKAQRRKKAKSLPLAPIEVEILISRGSAYKIATESGTNAGKKAQSFRSKKTIVKLI